MTVVDEGKPYQSLCYELWSGVGNAGKYIEEDPNGTNGYRFFSRRALRHCSHSSNYVSSVEEGKGAMEWPV